MSVESLAVVLNHSRAKGTDKVVLLGIANHMGDGGAWPSVATLARYANVADRTVQRSLDALVASGELLLFRQQGGTATMRDFMRPNRYELAVGCPINCDRTPNHRLIPLPKAPADLCIEGVTPTSPGDAHVTGGGDAHVTGGVTPTSPEPYINPPSKLVVVESALTTDRARAGLCRTCGLDYLECSRRSAVSGHRFEAKP